MSLIKAKGVDICVHKGDVDFDILKAYGVQFVMIGMGDRFHENVRKAEAAGMPWGAYYYTYSLSTAEDEQELQKILSRLEGLRPTYPIALDVEDAGDYKKKRGGWYQSTENRRADSGCFHRRDRDDSWGRLGSGRLYGSACRCAQPADVRRGLA